MNKYTIFHEEPRVSFGSFTFAWEQREFQNMFVERRDKTESEFEDTLLSCAINGMFLNSELFGHFRGSSTIGYLKVKKNDLILSAQNLHLGNANVNLRFEHGIISPAYKVYDIIDCDPKFIQSWVKKENTKNFFLSATTEGASQCRKNIEWETLNKQKISVPKFNEQKKIGAFLEVIDNLITLHQRESEFLYSVKHTKINKNNAYFTNDWEQRKLMSISSLITKGTTPLDKSNIGIVNFIKVENIDNSSGAISISQKISLDEHNGYLKRSQLQENDILFSIAGTLGRVTSVNSDILPANTNQALAIIRLKECDLEYIKTFLKSKSVSDYIRQNPTVGAQPNLSLEQIGNLEIQIPSLREQEQIGQYFTKLDNLITLHQREPPKKNLRRPNIC